MSETIYASIKTDWHADAACRTADDADFFPSEETERRLAHVKAQYCDVCPVQPNCLNSALINGDKGFWGGMSTSQRNALIRARTRVKCPACKSKQLIETEGETPYQVCLACAVSWRMDRPKTTLAAAS